MTEFVIEIKANNIEDILYTPLWYNPLIKIHNKPVFYTKFYEKGFYYIRDFFKNDGKFIEYGELSDLYQIHIPFTTFHGLKTSILSMWPNLRDIDKEDIIPLSHRPRYLSMLCKDEKGSKSIYNVFIKKLYQKPKSEEKWKVDLNLEDEFNWRLTNQRYYNFTKDSKLLWFHYRILHRILGTNKLLFQCKIKNSPMCSICKLETESLSHLFIECRRVKEMWSQVENWIEASLGERFTLTPQDIIFGCNTDVLNLIILITKQYIFQTSRKEQPLVLDDIKRKIYYYYKTEKIQSLVKGNTHKFDKKWNKWVSLFTGVQL